MRFQVQKCRLCPALGVGSRAVKLYPLDDHLYCKDHWREQLGWHENRKTVARWAESESETAKIITKMQRARARGVAHPAFTDPKAIKTDWCGYIQDLCDLAGWGLEVGDRRTFAHYAALAILAWGMQEVADNG